MDGDRGAGCHLVGDADQMSLHVHQCAAGVTERDHCGGLVVGDVIAVVQLPEAVRRGDRALGVASEQSEGIAHCPDLLAALDLAEALVEDLHADLVRNLLCFQAEKPEVMNLVVADDFGDIFGAADFSGIAVDRLAHLHVAEDLDGLFLHFTILVDILVDVGDEVTDAVIGRLDETVLYRREERAGAQAIAGINFEVGRVDDGVDRVHVEHDRLTFRLNDGRLPVCGQSTMRPKEGHERCRGCDVPHL